MPELNLIAAACESRSRATSAQALVNLYPEAGPNGEVTLYGTPGLTLWVQLTTGEVRGLFVAASSLFCVVSSVVYRINSAGVATVLGTIGSSSGSVSMASNGQQLLIVDGTTSGFFVSLSTFALTQITDTDFPGGVTAAFLDGFVLFNEPDTGKVWTGSSYDVSEIDGLDFATAEGAPDNIVGIVADHRELWLLGEESSEVYYNSGNPNFPFERVQGAFIEQGCASAASIVKLDNTVIWLGRDAKGRGIVWRAEGYTPRRISTHEIEFQISTYSRIDDAIAFSYQQDGHSFYVLTFPSADVTWCLDVATGKWHRRGWYSNGELHRHRANCHAFFGGMHIVGDHSNGKLYVMSMSAYTDDSDEIVREIVGQHIRSGKRVFYGECEVRIESGVGVTTGQGSDPKAMLCTSDDAGRTWSSWRMASIGKVGQYLTRITWRRLGSGNSKTFRIRISDPIPVAISGIRVEFSE